MKTAQDRERRVSKFFLQVVARPGFLSAILSLAATTDLSAQTLTTLYSFPAGGGEPRAGVVRDAAGNLYGTTCYGGGGDCNTYPCGDVYRLSKGGNFTELYSFAGYPSDGENPV